MTPTCMVVQVGTFWGLGVGLKELHGTKLGTDVAILLFFPMPIPIAKAKAKTNTWATVQCGDTSKNNTHFHTQLIIPMTVTMP